MVSRCIPALIAALLSVNLAWAKITSQVDRSVIEQGDTLNYILDLSESEIEAEDIDLSPLVKDFEVLNRSQQSSTSLSNGEFKSTTQLVLRLAPKSAGNLVIPSLSIGGESTSAHAIKVQKMDIPSAVDGGFEAFSTLSNESPKVQQALVYSFTLLLGRQVNGSIAAPEISTGEATVEPLGEQKQYKQTLKGKEIVVVEQNWLITPQKSGELSISAARLVGQVPTGQRRRDPFNGMVFRNTEFKRIDVPASSYRLEVGEIPTDYSGLNWLPAESLTLNQSWDSDVSVNEIEVGQPITRTFTLTARGASQLQLNEPVLPEIPGIKQYPDTPERSQSFQNNQLVSGMTLSVTMIPSRPGTVTLPEIQVPWWNVKTGRQEMAIIEAQEIQIKPSVSAMSADTEIAEKAEDSQPEHIAGSVDRLETEGGISTQQNESTDTNASKDSLLNEWYWLAGTLLAGLLLGILVTYQYMIRRVSTRTKDQPRELHRAPKPSFKALKLACEVNDPQAARTALVQWAEALDPQCSLSVVLGFSSRQLKDQIDQLNRVLYSNNKLHWDGSAFYQAVHKELDSVSHQVLLGISNKTGNLSTGLAPLYPGKVKQI